MRKGIHGIGVRIGIRTAVRSLLIIYLRALDNWIFWEPDAFAWVQEWQIGRRRLFRRNYRDARFAALLECGLCRGEGYGEARGDGLGEGDDKGNDEGAADLPAGARLGGEGGGPGGQIGTGGTEDLGAATAGRTEVTETVTITGSAGRTGATARTTITARTGATRRTGRTGVMARTGRTGVMETVTTTGSAGKKSCPLCDGTGRIDRLQP
ncbi:hypothetical protein [Streptosporangium sp. NPDC004631]